MEDLDGILASGKKSFEFKKALENVEGTTHIFWVSKKNNVPSSAWALFTLLHEKKDVEINTVGPYALNQAFKIVVNVSANFARQGRHLYVKFGMRNRPGLKEGEGEVSVCVLRFEIR